MPCIKLKCKKCQNKDGKLLNGNTKNGHSNGHSIGPALNHQKASTISLRELETILRTDHVDGLSSAESFRRFDFIGPNEFALKRKESIFLKFLKQFKNPLIFLLLISAIASIVMKQFDNAISISIAVLIVVIVGFIQEYRSEKILEKLNKLVPPMTHCIRNGKRQEIFARELVPGDLVLLNTGDRVPADLRIIESIQLQIDESSFTGENEPRQKHSNKIEKNEELSGKSEANSNSLQTFDNISFMGTLVCSGRGQGLVIATGQNTKFGEVFRLMQSEKSPKTPLQKSMNKLGKQLSIYSFTVIILIFGIGIIQGRPALDMFTIGVSLAVAAIPEGLPIVVTVTLAIGVMRMGKRNAVVKNLSAVETLGCVTVICSDKTGTLTKNEMTVRVVISGDGERAEVTGIGYDPFDGKCILPNGKPFLNGDSEDSKGISSVIEIGAICNNAQMVEGKLTGQPTEKALLVLAMKAKMENCLQKFRRLHEIPFSSENKWMAVEVESFDNEDKKFMMAKGAIDKIIPKCVGYLENGKIQQKILSKERIEQIQNEANELGKSGLRVMIAMALGDCMNSLYFAGFVGIMDPLRQGCRKSIELVKSSGVSIKMITGDSLDTAKSIGSHLHIYKNKEKGPSCVLSGTEIDRLSDSELQQIIRNISIFYRTSPNHKLRIVKALQEIGEIVAMTGDGVNDAVALKKADIGVAMGESGTDVCKEAADMVLLNDDFSTIRAAIEEGKGIYHNIVNFVKFQLSTSIAALTLISISTILNFENPLNAIQILWINIIMDGPPAQSLGVECVDLDIIRQKPRNVRQSLITKSLLIDILASATIILAGSSFVFYTEMAADYKVTIRDTTMTFTCFILFNIWNALACRSSRKMIWQIGLFSNKIFLLAIFFTLICQMLVIYLPPLQRMFKTEAISVYDWLYLTLLTSSVFIFNEGVKFIKLQISKRKMKKIIKKKEEFSLIYNIIQ